MTEPKIYSILDTKIVDEYLAYNQEYPDLHEAPPCASRTILGNFIPRKLINNESIVPLIWGAPYAKLGLTLAEARAYCELNEIPEPAIMPTTV